MPKEKKSAAPKTPADGGSARCAFNGVAGQCMLIGERSPDIGGVVHGDGTVTPARSYCAWHSLCREMRIGGRYRNDFEAFVDERRAEEKPLIEGAAVAPSHWYRHDAGDLWEACNGVRELPRIPGRVREHWTDRESEQARRQVPPSITRWFVSLCKNEVLEGKITADVALGHLRKRLAEHDATTADEVFE